MKLHPRVTQTAVDLVKRFEGFRPRAAKTPDGRFTIGYGHVLSPRDSAAEAEISQPEAEFLLKHDLSVTAQAVEDALLAPVNENQFSALLSFAFNIGAENFKGSSAVHRLNEGAYLQAAAAIELWRRADFNGDVLVVDQLVRRRAVEKALFLAPPEGFLPLPSSMLRPTFDHSVVGAAVAWAAARERTAVTRIALEGPDAAADLATPPGREGEPAPSAAIAAADALAVRLSRILQDEPPEALTAAPEAESPPSETPGQAALSHAPAHEPLGEEPVADEASLLPPEDVAPQHVAPEHVANDAAPAHEAIGEADASPAPLVEHDAFEPAVGPQLVLSESEGKPTDLASWRRPPVIHPEDEALEAPAALDAPAPPEPMPASLFGAPSPEAPAAVGEAAHDPAHDLSSEPPPLSAPAIVAETAVAETATPPAPPLFERPVFFVVLGLVGVALFIGSIFCMLNRASFTCLLIGVLGVLAMAPAAAFFLFRFLGKPVEPGATPPAASTPDAEPDAKPVLTPVPDAPAEAANDRPFDNAWR